MKPRKRGVFYARAITSTTYVLLCTPIVLRLLSNQPPVQNGLLGIDNPATKFHTYTAILVQRYGLELGLAYQQPLPLLRKALGLLLAIQHGQGAAPKQAVPQPPK